MSKAGRKPGAKLLADIARASGMRPAPGPDGRRENARRSAQHAVEIAAIFNQHFTEPEWQVLVPLLGMYFAVADGAQREARSAADGWTMLDATRAYMPALAPPPSHPTMQCILPARMFGKSLRDDRVGHSATTSFRSATHADRTVIGTTDGSVDFAAAAGTREMEACAHVLAGTGDCWQNDIPPGVPRQADGGLTLDAAIAALGKLVGTCPDAERAAMSFFGYCIERHSAGAPMISPHLRLCAGLRCHTPVFMWRRKATRQGIGTAAAPNYCPDCLGPPLGDDRSLKAKAHREQRRRRRKKSPERGA